MYLKNIYDTIDTLLFDIGCCINILASVRYRKRKSIVRYRMKGREHFRLATRPLLGKIYSVIVKEYRIVRIRVKQILSTKDKGKVCFKGKAEVCPLFSCICNIWRDGSSLLALPCQANNARLDISLRYIEDSASNKIWFSQFPRFISILRRCSDELRSFRLRNTYVTLETILSYPEWSSRKKREEIRDTTLRAEDEIC